MEVVGHRGARGLAPENTIAGLEKGLEYSVAELEFDLRVTKDGIVVLHHDEKLHDAVDNTLEIAAHTYKELKAHKADLATFNEILDTIGHPVPLLVEIKPGVATEPIIKIISERLESGWSTSDFRLASRSLPILRDMQAAFPDIERVVIEIWSGVRATWKARQVKTRRISMFELWLWSGFISSVASSGYELYAFPAQKRRVENFWAKFGRAGFANNPKKVRHWQEHGLAGVITDFPDRFN